MYKLNKKSMDLIKGFEGWRPKAYKDSVGVWTIGYGHTSMAGPPKVRAGMKITKAFGEDLLQKDLQKYAKAVDDAVKVELNSNQFGALVSFCYNVGPGNFRKSSVLRYTNKSRFSDVPARLMLWNKAGGLVLRGLTRRRKAEGNLFMSTSEKFNKVTVPTVTTVTTTAVVVVTFWDKIKAFFEGLI